MDKAEAKGVDARHEDSEEKLTVWKRARDCRKGQQAIHKAGEAYLPRLSGQKDEEYQSYKNRAVFYGAMSRTVDAFAGMIMRVPPIVDSESQLLENVTNTGVNLYDFSAKCLDEFLTIGFGGILVDHTPDRGAATIAQARALGARPYLCRFSAQNILNWYEENGKFKMVVLEEEIYVKQSEFVSVEQDVYLVLDITEEGFYRQRRFVEDEKRPDYFIQVGDDVFPLKNGQRMTEIPFYFIGDYESLPPLIDIVDLNISHYMTTADLENGRHFTGLPTPIVSGVSLGSDEATGKPVTLNIGSSAAWVFPQPDAKAYYMEFSGQGLSSLEKGLETKEKQMAALGARMLSDVQVAETAYAAGIRSAGEFSVLAMIAKQLGNVLTQACSFMLEWAGEAPVTITFNTDFIPARMTPQELQALVQAWQAGAISYQTMYANMVQGEIIAPGGSAEDEQATISETAPVMIAP